MAGNPSSLEPWTGAECRAFDAHLQQDLRIPAALLMENAGAALAEAIGEALAEIEGRRVLFAVGPGNNGGDALVAARQLAGTPELDFVLVAPLGLRAPAGSPAAAALDCVRALGIPVQEGPCSDALAAGVDLVVDGLFGVGLARELAGQALQAVESLRDSGEPILAVDVPSGLDCDTGEPLGAAVEARWTLSFVAPKAGFFRGAGPRCVGACSVAGIGVSSGYAGAWLARRRFPIKDE